MVKKKFADMANRVPRIAKFQYLHLVGYALCGRLWRAFMLTVATNSERIFRLRKHTCEALAHGSRARHDDLYQNGRLQKYSFMAVADICLNLGGNPCH